MIKTHSVELKARQILNTVRELFHLHHKLVIGAYQESDSQVALVLVEGSNQELPVRQS